MKTFAENLRHARIERGLSQEQLAMEVMTGLEEALDFCKGNACSTTMVHKRSEEMTGKETIVC